MFADAKAHIPLSIIAAFFGRFEINQIALGHFAESLDQIFASAPADIEVIVVFADSRWQTLPTAQSLSTAYASVTTLTAPEEDWSPAHLFNRGMASAAGQRMLFTSARDLLSPHIVDSLAAASRSDGPIDEILAIADHDIAGRYGLPHGLSGENLYGWLLNGPLLSPSSVAIPRRLLEAMGGFDPSPLMQRSAEWDLLLRLARSYNFTFLDGVQRRHPVVADMAAHFPVPVPVSDDLQRRYLSRRLRPPDTRQSSFLKDIPEGDAAYLRRRSASLARSDPPAASPATDRPGPLKITVTGGPWEYHHNRLCFFNYVDNLEGSGFATYKSLFDHLVTRNDIVGSDIVILSRCKVDNVRNIIGWCRDLRIPSIYMIDDNWLTVAADWPDLYKASFSPGTPNYENFLFGISNADHVLTYNRLLISDLAPYACQVISLPNSVDLAAFEATPRPVSDRFLIGYSGSARFTDAPFAALGEIGRARSDVDLLVFGTVLPHQRNLIAGCRIIELPHLPYEQYAREIRKTGVDILLGPLDDTRTSRSKCPNKYLETTAAGAVGVYSDVEPYIWCIRQGQNGVLVHDHSQKEAWRQAVEGLLDKDLLGTMHATARTDIATSFDVPVVAKQFAALMRRVHAAREFYR
jgi:hypothetical protein